MSNLETRLAQLDEQFAAADRALECRKRGQRIADRLIPLAPRAHGFYQPVEFFDGAVIRYWNRRLGMYLGAILEARSEGRAPRIGVPKNSEHLFGPGDRMFDLAAYIEAQKAAGLL